MTGRRGSADAFRYRLLSGARVISLLPTSRLRVFLLRRLLGYAIDPTTRIGFGTLILVAEFKVGKNARIGRYCRFKGPMAASIDDGSRIGGHNVFHCSRWLGETGDRGDYAHNLRIGKKAVITSDHYFDCTGSMSIGARTVIAGRGSQFWTHGAGALDRNVEIGEGCYVGSAARVAPGTRVGNDNIIAMGSVVVGDLSAVTLSMIAGVPARVIRPVDRDPKSGRVLIEIPEE
jgi:acetyltransferase-like isoleucine patch superfamily enzyme